MATSMEQAWNYIWDKMYCDKTSLIYDSRFSDDPDANIRFLPSPEHIRLQIPNPCSWGTGMENSMMSAGVMMDAVLARYQITKEPEMKDYADKLFRGIVLCATISGKEGFLARSVSPADGTSFYIDSSRDQYTHVVDGLYRFYHSELCEEDQKEQIRDILVSFAVRAEKNITPENDYNYLRADGGKGAVVKMWGNIRHHEYMRLPMIYAAAWNVSGEPHWLEQYLKYRDEGMAVSEQIDFDLLLDYITGKHNVFAALQMQYSMRIIYEIDPDPVFRERCLTFMKRTASYYEHASAEYAALLTRPAYKEKVHYMLKPWEKQYAHMDGLIDGYAYYVPGDQRSPENAFFDLLNFGDSLSIIALCPGASTKQQIASACQVVDIIDFDHFYNEGILHIIGGYWMAKS